MDLGAPILATHDGTVTRLARIEDGDTNAGGNRIVITSEDGVVATSYMHLDEIGKGLKVGMKISEGQQIGTMGKSGNGKLDSYKSHLHYELRINGEVVNPAIDSQTLIDPQNLLAPLDGGILNEVEIKGVKLDKLTDIKPELKF